MASNADNAQTSTAVPQAEVAATLAQARSASFLPRLMTGNEMPKSARARTHTHARTQEIDR